jgi:hypothetical protein
VREGRDKLKWKNKTKFELKMKEIYNEKEMTT